MEIIASDGAGKHMKTTTDAIHKVILILEKSFEALDDHPKAYTIQTEIAHAVELLRPCAVDWTKYKGHANSSPAFDTIVNAVEQLIRSQAPALINGRVDSVATLIIAQLAHVWKLVPMEDPVCQHRSGETFDIPCPKCHRSTDWSGK